MGKIKLVLFDMDGLLIDSERAMWAVNNRKVIESMGLEYNVPVFRSLMGGGLKNSEKTLDDYYGNGFNAHEFFNEVIKLNNVQIQKGEVPVMKGAYELMSFLKENNIKMAIATSTMKGLASIIVKAKGFDKYINEYVFGDEVVNGKPDPEIYLTAYHKFKDINKDEVLVFEDAHYGARAGLAAGFDVILIPNGAPTFAEDLKECKYILNSLDEAIDIIKDINK